jgi:Zn-dependent protease with chaperone function
MRTRGGSLLVVASAVLAGLPAWAGTEKPKEEKVEGYAEWRSGGCLLVDAQRVCTTPATKWKGGGATGLDQVPFGYEVKAKGVRRADGAIEAREVEVKPNGMAMFEGEVLEVTNDAEEAYRKVGHMFEQVSEDKAVDLGRLYDSGPVVDRVRRITARLLPPYLEPERVRVYVVDNPEWNAMAMGNYSIYVFSGLLRDMDDDEVAIVLGHELVHATHEHTRREFKKQMWIQLAALGLAAATEGVKDDNAKAVLALVGQFGALAWQNGYGRSLEDQADRVGLRYAYEAGFDVTKGPRLWQRFARKYGDSNKVHNFFFSNHSQSSARAAKLERELALNYPDGPKSDGAKATRVAAGAAPSGASFLARPTPSAGAPAPGSRKELRVGMTSAEVEAILGRPDAEIVFGGKTQWTYSSVSVVFQGGRVSDVRF